MTWLVAVSRPQRERRAAEELAERGFEAWYPERLVRVSNRYTKHLRDKPTRAYPAFPGYVFARPSGTRPRFAIGTVDNRRVQMRIGDEPYWATADDLLAAEDVRGVLCNNLRPVLVTEAEVDRVRSHTASLAMIHSIEPYLVGQEVFIAAGPLLGQCGPVEFVRSQQASVLLDILGRQTSVIVPIEDLRRAA